MEEMIEEFGAALLRPPYVYIYIYRFVGRDMIASVF